MKRRAVAMPAALVAALLGCGAALAQPQAWRLDAGAAPLRIDGRLDEPAWADAPVHDTFVQYLPLDRQPAPAGYRTTLQIVVEAHALVIGLRAWDPRPQDIRAPLMRRDKVARDQDFVAVLIDPSGSRRSAQFVRVNAAGVVADGMFVVGRQDEEEDFAPDFELDAAVQRLPDGYSVELRLPLLSLRYPHEGGAPWRLMALRSIPRDDSVLLTSAPLTKDAISFIAELQEIGGMDAVAEQARSQALLSIRPELTLRSTRDDDGRGRRGGSSRASLGAEIKWRPRADWVFDATLNPDFSQVELDVPQLAVNTRFAQALPEKRPFFLESTDVIALPEAAFYSRTVTDPAWGLRATWRGASADATALSLRDEGGGLLRRPGPFGTAWLPQQRRSQATLLRGRWHGGEQFSAGALLSTREEAEGGANNRVAGVDVEWRPGPEQRWSARAMASRSRDAGIGPGENGHHLQADWLMRTPDWQFTAQAIEISPRFRNDNGFFDQAGVRIAQTEVIRRWGEAELPGPFALRAHELETYLWVQHRSTLADGAQPAGQTVLRQLHPGLWLAAARNTEAWVQLQFDAERARRDTPLRSTTRLAAGYTVNPAPWLTRLNVEGELGRRLDVDADRVGRGTQLLAELNLRAPLGRWWLESEQRVEHVAIAAPDGRRARADTALQWLAVLHADARDSLRVIWQGTRSRRFGSGEALPPEDARGEVASLVFLRRFGVGRSLSLGWSRQAERPAPGLPREREREVFAKISIDVP
ncbi:DUF5916 domain-containing protein [Piscinibacter sp.]|uniref:DUF5916 domain-containing protein n=1 Tax=Piscinibacter sp. TaxID=1903157 RepID=UPI0039E5AB7E